MTKRTTGKILAKLNGALDGMELDNTCDVIPKSEMISFCKELVADIESTPAPQSEVVFVVAQSEIDTEWKISKEHLNDALEVHFENRKLRDLLGRATGISFYSSAKDFEKYLRIIPAPQSGEGSDKLKMFTEKEIESLQSEVYKITGKGNVMALFNKLLGINAS